MTERTRRAFLTRTLWPATAASATTVLGAWALPACTKHRSGTASIQPGGANSGDLAIVELATSLENLAVATYQSVMDAAATGKFGPNPAAITTYLAAAQRQHREHAAGWNAGLNRIGQKPVTGLDATFKSVELDAAMARAKTITDLAKFVLFLENVMAATYLDAIQAGLQSAAAVRIAATIHPVEMQHAAVLEFLIGNYPVPDSFANSSGARPVSDQIA